MRQVRIGQNLVRSGRRRLVSSGPTAIPKVDRRGGAGSTMMATMNMEDGSAATALEHHSKGNHVVHRLAHAIYGLILLAAVVGDLSTHDDDMRTAIVLVAGGAIVLVFAHSYSQLVAAASMTYERPPWAVIGRTLVDQLALAVPAALAVGLFALGAADVISDRAAYNLVILGSLGTLFALGVVMGLHRQKGVAWSLALGVSNTMVGLVIIGIEASAAH